MLNKSLYHIFTKLKIKERIFSSLANAKVKSMRRDMTKQSWDSELTFCALQWSLHAYNKQTKQLDICRQMYCLSLHGPTPLFSYINFDPCEIGKKTTNFTCCSKVGLFFFVPSLVWIGWHKKAWQATNWFHLSVAPGQCHLCSILFIYLFETILVLHYSIYIV